MYNWVIGSSFEFLNVSQYLRVIVHMILSFLLEVLHILTVLIVLLSILVLIVFILYFKVVTNWSLYSLLILVVVLFLIIQILCHWIFHLQIIFKTITLCVFVECTVNVVFTCEWWCVVRVCVQGCLCAELRWLLPCFVVVWCWAEVISVAWVWNVFSTWRKSF